MVEKSKGGFLISKIKQIQGRVFEKLLSKYGIDQFNGAQGRILYVLWNEDTMPISALSEKTGLAKTTLTGMLDRLEASRFVQRALDPGDRRTVNILLTEEAKRMKSRYDEVSTRMTSLFYEGFNDNEIIRFEKTLERILTNLTKKEQ